MACHFESINLERVPPNSAIFRVKCSGTCEGGGKCTPHIAWDGSKNGRVTMSFQPFAGGGGEAIMEITAEKDIEKAKMTFSCLCPPDAEGQSHAVVQDYEFSMDHQTTLPDVLGRIADILTVGLKPLVQHFLSEAPLPVK